MTEKRFEYVKPVVAFAKSGVIDNLKRNTFDFTEDNVIDILNELSDENDVLKQQLKTKYIVNKQYEELQKVKEENENLKIDLGIADDVHKLDREIIDDLHLSWKKLEKEKKELQKENEVLKSENSHLKAILMEYEEQIKGDD